MQGKDFGVLPKPLRSWRSHTIGINVVQRSGGTPQSNSLGDHTDVNVFVDGRADSSHVLPGTVSLGEALIWYGTQLKLKGDPT